VEVEELLQRFREEAQSRTDAIVAGLNDLRGGAEGAAESAAGAAGDAAGQAGDVLENLRREAHALAGTAGTLSQERLQELGALIEEALQSAGETGGRISDELSESISKAAAALAEGADAAANNLPEPDSLRDAISDLAARVRG